MFDENYPEPLNVQTSRNSLWRVILLILVFVGIAGYFTIYGSEIPSQWFILFLGVLAIAGVFCLFALASGLFVISSGAEGRTLSRSLLDSATDGVVIANKKGEITYANRKYLQMSKKISEGAPVGVIRLFANQPEAGEAMHRLALASREGRHAIEDIRLTRNFDGSRTEGNKPLWFRIIVRSLPPLQNNEQTSLTWIVRDISADRDRQENTFQELQRAIDYLDHAPAGFFSADKDGSIQYINATLADWLGIDLAEFEPGDLRLENLVRGDGSSLLMGGRADGKIKTQIIDIDLVHRNGTSFPVRLLHRAARLAEGELGETRTLVLDRKKSGENPDELRAAEVKFSRFFNDTPFAIATLDGEGRIVSTNAPFARIFNISTTEKAIENAVFSELIDSKNINAFHEALKGVKQNLSQIEPVDALLANDEERSVRLYLSPSEKIGNSTEEVIVYTLDMTEYTKLQAQFVQAQKMQAIGQLAGGVAHDFNNVLTAIIGFADLLFLRHKSTDPSFSDIMQIKQSANRAAALVRQLLAYSRQQTLRPRILELPTHIDDYNIFLKRLMTENVTLSVSHDRDVWPIKADVVQLEQVVLNLAINARDAMPEGGEITLRTRNVMERESATFSYRGMPAADYVLIEVEDNGTGIPEEVLKKMYEPYFSTKEQGKGTGLGLSMVYGIVKQTGGFIYADTEIGKGTKFRVFFPRYVPNENELEKAVEPAPQRVIKDLTGNERILIVEDDDMVRAISVRTLKTTGYEVFEADGGEEALEILDEIDNKIDLMISDVMMPGMDGPSLLIEVRKRLPDVKVIFVSGFAEDEVRKSFADDHSVEYLAKPYSFDQINSKVKTVLSGSDRTETKN